MATPKTIRRQVNISFIRPEDVELYDRLREMAKARRYPVATFVVLSLHEAFREVETGAAAPPELSGQG